MLDAPRFHGLTHVVRRPLLKGSRSWAHLPSWQMLLLLASLFPVAPRPPLAEGRQAIATSPPPLAPFSQHMLSGRRQDALKRLQAQLAERQHQADAHRHQARRPRHVGFVGHLSNLDLGGCTCPLRGHRRLHGRKRSGTCAAEPRHRRDQSNFGRNRPRLVELAQHPSRPEFGRSERGRKSLHSFPTRTECGRNSPSSGRSHPNSSRNRPLP